MLNNSADVSQAANSKNRKKLLNHDGALKHKNAESDFIPLDKEDSENNSQSRYQRDRSHQKSYYKNSYYNGNRYQNRGVYNGNHGSTYKNASNSLKGHPKHSYGGPSSQFASTSHPNGNNTSNSYPRTKRKRDSSAISSSGRDQTQSKKDDINTHSDTISSFQVPKVSLSEKAIEEIQFKNKTLPQSTVKSLISTDALLPNKTLETTSQDNVQIESTTKGGNKTSKHPESAEKRKANENIDSNVICGKNEELHYDKKESIEDKENAVNTPIISIAENFKEKLQDEIGNGDAFAAKSQTPVWYRGRPYGGGAIG